MGQTLRVGIVGASAVGTGWARDSHVPAIQGLSGLELRAVATSRRDVALDSARLFGAAKGYGDASELIADPEIDVVTVATRVPGHRDIVLAALAAGKHVYSEWPLGRDVAESREMAQAARTAGRLTAIGLQLRASPTVRRARELLASGRIGRLLHVSVASDTAGFGGRVPEARLYTEEPGNGANLLTIQAAHTIDLAIAVAGALTEVAGQLSTRFPEIVVAENGERRARITADHVLVQGRLAGGAPLCVEVVGGRPPQTPFHLEAVGETGVLRLEGGAPRGVQSGRLRLLVDGEPQAVDEGEGASLTDVAANVAGVYAALRDDIRRGTRSATGFDHAVRLAALVADIEASSRDGSRRRAAGWPEG